jgi:hypothetical protein
MVAMAAERIAMRPALLASLGPELAGGARRRESAGRDRNGANTLWAPFHGKDSWSSPAPPTFAIAEGTVKARPVMVEVDKMLSTTPRCLRSIQRFARGERAIHRAVQRGAKDRIRGAETTGARSVR